MIEILSKAIQIKTTSDVIDENIPKLHKLLEESFPNVHKSFEKRVINGSLLFKYEAHGKPMMMCAHQDVVPAIKADWSCEPFSGMIDDEYVWGRGTLDCKGTLIATLSAMEQALIEGFKPTRTIYLAFGHDEEIGGPHGAQEIVKVLKSEGVKLDLLLDEGGFVSKDFLPDRNFASVSIAEKNILRLKLIARAKGGHAAYMTEKTALYRVAKAIIAVEENPIQAEIIPLIGSYLEKLTDYPEITENFINNPKNAPYVRTTMAPTMTKASEAMNILPNEPYVALDIRMLPNMTTEKVLAHLENILQGLDIDIEIMLKPANYGKTTDFNSEIFKNIESLIKEKFDDAIVVPYLMLGGTDARHYEDICDNVFRFMPILMTGELSKTIHTANERIEISSYNKACDWYKEFIKRNG